MYSFCTWLSCIKYPKCITKHFEHSISKLHSSWFFSSHPTQKKHQMFHIFSKISWGCLNFFKKKTSSFKSFKNLHNLRPISPPPTFLGSSASKSRRSGTFRKAIRICVHRRHTRRRRRDGRFLGEAVCWASWSPWYHHLLKLSLLQPCTIFVDPKKEEMVDSINGIQVQHIKHEIVSWSNVLEATAACCCHWIFPAESSGTSPHTAGPTFWGPYFFDREPLLLEIHIFLHLLSRCNGFQPSWRACCLQGLFSCTKLGGAQRRPLWAQPKRWKNPSRRISDEKMPAIRYGYICDPWPKIHG